MATPNSITEWLQQRTANVEVILEATDIFRGTNGKFRAVICNLSPEERGQIAKQ